MTMDPRRELLQICADELSQSIGGGGLVNTRAVLKFFGIPLVKRVDTSIKSSYGTCERNSNGNPIIVIIRNEFDIVPLTQRERFSIAHEVAHIILKERFNWNPITGKEYYLCEQYCDEFAGRLLVPTEYLRTVQIASAKKLVDEVIVISKKYKVSNEVAAKRLFLYLDNAAIFQAYMTNNIYGQVVIKMDWGISSIKQIKALRDVHIKNNTTFGKVMHDSWNMIRKERGACIRFENCEIFGCPKSGSNRDACLVACCLIKAANFHGSITDGV